MFTLKCETYWKINAANIFASKYLAISYEIKTFDMFVDMIVYSRHVNLFFHVTF